MDVYEENINESRLSIIPALGDEVPMADDIIKMIIFTEIKGDRYKYHPIFVNIFYKDNKTVRIQNLFDRLKREIQHIDSPEYKKHMMVEYKINKDQLKDAIDIVLKNEGYEKIIENIENTLADYVKLHGIYYNKLSPGIEINDSNKYSPTSDKWSSISPTSSSSGGSFFNFGSESEQSAEKKVIEVQQQEELSIMINNFYIFSNEKLNGSIDLLDFFQKTQLNKNLLAVGMNVNNENKVKKAINLPIKKERAVKNFTKSEHKIHETKTFKPGRINFLYYFEPVIVYVEVNIKGKTKMKVVPISPLFYKNYDSFLKLIEQHINQIQTSIKTYVPVINYKNNIEGEDLSVKITYNKGYLDYSIIGNAFKDKYKKLQNVATFTMVLTGDFQNLNYVRYSTKDDKSNFSFNDIPSILYISQIQKRIEWLFKTYKSDIKGKVQEIKKKDIKGIRAENIPYNARECQKARRVDILKGESSLPEHRVMLYNGVLLGCNNDSYPYPGYTKKNSIPCCFKRIQKIKKEEDETPEEVETLLNSSSITKVSKLRPLNKDNVSMKIFQRGSISNIILKDIFSESDGYYSLSLGKNVDSIEGFIQRIYGEKVIEESSTSITKDLYEKYFENTTTYEQWKNTTKTTQEIIRCVSISKKVNIIVVSYENLENKFVCSHSSILDNDQYMVILRPKNYIRMLIRIKDGTFYHSFVVSNDQMQQFIRLYNKSCSSITNCEDSIPSLREIQKYDKYKKLIPKKVFLNANNQVFYIKNNYGIIPISPSKVQYDYESGVLTQEEFSEYKNQLELLKEVSNKMKYLKPKALVLDIEKYITGIEISCNLVVPVKKEKYSGNEQLQPSNNYRIDSDIFSDIKEEIISGEELKIFKSSMEEKTVKMFRKVLANYFTKNEEDKNDILIDVEDQNYDNIIEKLTKKYSVIVDKDINKRTIPIEETIPFPIYKSIYTDVLSIIAWQIINNTELFFEEIQEEKDTSFINVNLIPNMEEVEIDLRED